MVRDPLSRPVARALHVPLDHVGWVEAPELRAAGAQLRRHIEPGFVVRLPWASVVVGRSVREVREFLAAWQRGACTWLLDALALDYEGLAEAVHTVRGERPPPPPWARPNDVDVRLRAWADTRRGVCALPDLEVIVADPAPGARDYVWLRDPKQPAAGTFVRARWLDQTNTAQ